MKCGLRQPCLQFYWVLIPFTHWVSILSYNAVLHFNTTRELLPQRSQPFSTRWSLPLWSGCFIRIVPFRNGSQPAVQDTWCFISIWSARTQGIVCMTKIFTKSQSGKEPPEVIQSSLLPLGRTALRTFPKIFRKGGSTDFLDNNIHNTTSQTLRERFPSASPKPLPFILIPISPKWRGIKIPLGLPQEEVEYSVLVKLFKN